MTESPVAYGKRMEDFFAITLDEHKSDDAQAVRWGDRHRQNVYNSTLLRQIPWSPGEKHTICDVGCGLGVMIDHLPGNITVQYKGVDVVPRMITGARKRHPGCQFEVDNILEPKTDIHADWLVSCGPMGTMSVEQVQRSIYNMWENAKGGIFFQMPSSWHYQGDGIHYNPTEIIDWCRRFTTRINMDHNFAPHLFNIAMYK